MKEGCRLTLNRYLNDREVDQIESDAEFCEVEHNSIAEYFQIYKVSEEDIKEAEARGYDTSFF